jgi:Fe(3+) dicitrate transport protein
VFKNFLSSRQYSYLLSQFSNETYSKDVIASGVTGEIPAADILDLSVSYKHKFMKLGDRYSQFFK